MKFTVNTVRTFVNREQFDTWFNTYWKPLLLQSPLWSEKNIESLRQTHMLDLEDPEVGVESSQTAFRIKSERETNLLPEILPQATDRIESIRQRLEGPVQHPWLDYEQDMRLLLAELYWSRQEVKRIQDQTQKLRLDGPSLLRSELQDRYDVALEELQRIANYSCDRTRPCGGGCPYCNARKVLVKLQGMKREF